MSKFSLYHRLTMVKDTYNEFEFKFGDRRDVYIHQIIVNFDYTSFANVIATDKQGWQLSKTNEAALVPLSNNVIFKVVQVTGDAAMADYPFQQHWFYEFKTPIKFSAVESFWIGALMADAGFCEVKLLCSQKNVAL